MLFCPFCGEAIVIPDQDEREAPGGDSASAAEFVPLNVESAGEAPADEPEEKSGEAPDAAAELEAWNRTRDSGEDLWARRDEPETPQEPFTPLQLEQGEETTVDWRKQISLKKESVVLEKKPPEIHRAEENPVRLEGSAPELKLDAAGAQSAGRGKSAKKHANTLVPPKTMNPNDIFMDDKDPAFDAVDPYDDEAADDYAGAFAYEDDEDNGFFMRHLRGIIGFALFIILILMFVIYSFFPSGQLSLARINMAWSTDAYSQLGYQSYQDGRYAEAGQFYERALQRDPGNYSFASSAAMAYFQAEQTEKSAEMLKKCIEINPTLLEPYVYLLKLYPEAAQRPWDVTQLLQQGYRETGDARLNVTG